MQTELGKDTMRTLVGEVVSPGLAQGHAFVYRDVLQRDVEIYAIDRAQVEEEKTRMVDAIADVRQSLLTDAQRMEARLGTPAADIFRAQEAILLDSTVVEELKQTVETEQLNAEHVVRTVFQRLARRFRDMNEAMFQARGDDIDDLSRRLLLSLAGIQAHSLENLPANTVLVARRLLPSDTVFLSRESTVAVLAEFAGPAAHAALLARELGIPCVGGIPELLDTVHTGDVVLVNGHEGTAVLNPDSYARQRFERVLNDERKRKEARAQESRGAPAMTLDGIEVAVLANVRSREDVELAMHCGADGIGLFRTEPFFLAAKHFPSDREFADFLLDSLQPAQGRQVDIRLLDIGADKNPRYLHLPPEPDPFLGRRGVRVLLEYPDLLEAQLRALLEVSQHFRIGVLIPMVTTESDVVQVVERFHHLAEELGVHTLPRIGAMIETPAAALSVPTLKQHVDFFSIGSNDLTQYTLAAGRENPLVRAYFLDGHPSILRLIELVIREAGDTPVSLCGELAGRIEMIPRLLRAGLRSLSLPAALVPDVKYTIRNTHVTE
jgi:phosphoenolpyruvate-protein phosphotransferase (PTS system enzyme I)